MDTTMTDFRDRIVLENARMLFRNFSGVEGKYNKDGDRNFGVLIPGHFARELERDGWNVKWLEPREEGDPEDAFIRVSVAFKKGKKKTGPRVILISSEGRTKLTDETIDLLDDVDILTTDMIIRPYRWEVNGKTGIKAYLQSMFVTIEESPLDRKYAAITPSFKEDPPWENDEEDS